MLLIGELCSKLKAQSSRRYVVSQRRAQAFSLQPSAFNSGMTLIELLVVMGIIALVVGISVPTWSAYAKSAHLKGATRSVVGFLVLARSTAISAHRPYAVVIDPEQRQLRIVDEQSGEALERVVHLSSSVSLTIESGGQPSAQTRLVFHPTGSLEGRSVSLVLANREKQQTIVVTASTGAVLVQD